jgi:hypothetical protein
MILTPSMHVNFVNQFTRYNVHIQIGGEGNVYA